MRKAGSPFGESMLTTDFTWYACTVETPTINAPEILVPK